MKNLNVEVILCMLMTIPLQLIQKMKNITSELVFFIIY